MRPHELKKAIAYNDKEETEGDLTSAHRVRALQFWQEHHDLDDDGWGGPLTQHSIDGSISTDWSPVISHQVSLLDESQFVNGIWLPFNGPLDSQPSKYSEMNAFFGNPETSPGSDVMSKAWYKANIVECHEKLGNRLPGVPAKWWVKVHRLVEPYLREACRRAQLTSKYRIKRMGSFNFRHIRNNPKLRLSAHASGIAFDIDYEDNGAIMYKRGVKVPEAWSLEWNTVWPRGVDRKFVQAWASCGFGWGSDWDADGMTSDHRWQDPMHFEFLARDGNQTDV